MISPSARNVIRQLALTRIDQVPARSPLSWCKWKPGRFSSVGYVISLSHSRENQLDLLDVSRINPAAIAALEQHSQAARAESKLGH